MMTVPIITNRIFQNNGLAARKTYPRLTETPDLYLLSEAQGPYKVSISVTTVNALMAPPRRLSGLCEATKSEMELS